MDWEINSLYCLQLIIQRGMIHLPKPASPELKVKRLKWKEGVADFIHRGLSPCYTRFVYVYDKGF
jgi:hypothetical protein